jgi:paraquat-inducible protein B
MIGGIAFETPENLEPGGAADENMLFRLYEDYESIHQKTYALKRYYVLYFDESIRGLGIGAPVEFRGIPLGEVVDISLMYKNEDTTFRIPVLIALEPERIDFAVDPDLDRAELLDRLIRKGLRAQLRTGSLITGQLFVDLGFHPDAAPPAPPETGGRYPEIPTLPAPLQEITTSLTGVLNRMGKIPFEEIGRNLNRLIEDMQQLADTAEGKLVQVATDLRPALASLQNTLEETRLMVQRFGGRSASMLENALDQTRKTMTTAENLFSADAVLYNELQNTLKELSEAARSVRLLADYLERHPDALIRGKGEE